MKRIVSTFLILAVFSLSLACLMPLCSKKAEAASTQSSTVEVPCHEMMDQENTVPDTSDMSMMDCLDQDFVHSVQALNLTPKHDISEVDWNLFGFEHLETTAIQTHHFAWGPPHEFIVSDSNFPPVFLTTQRLRI